MTDNEIIRCLRLCRAGDCENCKALNVCDATFSFHKDALNLINRQKEDIERLEKELMKCKLEKEMLYQTVEEIKSEAIKEFARFVIDRSRNGVIYTSDIPDLVKEMTEIETNQRKEDEGK